MRTMLITDGSFGRDPLFFAKLQTACQAGIDAVQLREKQLPCKELFYLAKHLRKLTADYGVDLFINEQTDVALAVKADGVHLPEKALFLKSPLRTGRSVHSIESARQAQQEGVDYILFGPVFEPLSKKISQKPQGLENVQQIMEEIKIPVIGVGGITPTNAYLLAESGVSGVAAVTSLMHAPDLAANIAALKAAFTPKKRQVQGLYVILSSFVKAHEIIHGGADAIQFRHKGVYTVETLDTARKIRALCHAATIPFVVNDRCDIALELEADGVHLGQEDLPIMMARRLLGFKKIIGATVSTIEQALAAEAAGADYVSFGHIFPTSSKKKEYPPIGLEVLKEAKAKLKVPLIAIGGISEHNALSVVLHGANGIAVISALEQSNNPAAAIRNLKKVIYDGNLQATNRFA